MAAPNGSLYGIPSRARRVAKFNPVDKSMTHIGPDFGDAFGDACKWENGAMTDSGVIYCVPHSSYESWGDAVLSWELMVAFVLATT